ncbi:hypothetical protein TWF696_006098 [Orbilia brochopaga]|uniref:Elongator complex protein 2 n=1 Tax=Orbilia brochopaga TaxID=3140254 RepID=A0AAV9UWM5_9PEZI
MTDTQGRIALSFIAVGANRIPTASDWDVNSGLIAYGAGNTIAIWQPEETDTSRSGVLATLKGHTDKVNAARFIENAGTPDDSVLVSGSVDKTLRIWRRCSASNDGEGRYEHVAVGLGHEGSVVDIAVERRASMGTHNPDANSMNGTIIASASADGTVKIWAVDLTASDDRIRCIQTITTKPKYLPLSIALARPQSAVASDAWILAVAGSSSAVQIYVCDSISTGEFKHAASLTGHENWIRSLSFVRDSTVGTDGVDGDSDLLLASGSQDKYIRLWRVHRGSELPAQSAGSSAVVMGQALSNRAHRFEVAQAPYSVTFEALLLGHEDWIYSVSWRRAADGAITLLSSSADNSLSIWQADETSGIWVCIARLGEASGAKGSSTATGSTGGFWTGLWAPDGRQVVSFGKSGGWRRWIDEGDGTWSQRPAAKGHVRDATGVAWEKSGRYLLSTSLDQSTRLYARWKSSKHRSWFEFSRPQIHGYDINSIVSLSSTKFVSGAEEKLLRVFGEPRGIAQTLRDMCDIRLADIEALPDVANQPVLGLSNKAVTGAESRNADADEEPSADNDVAGEDATTESVYPPFEDSLSRHTLWPEEEKLYGHGYEISTVACSNRGDVIATACKASSVTHAVIRLFETKTWRQLKPALEAHSLTVNRIAFSADDKYMLSVGRDRQWTVFERDTAVTSADDDLTTPYTVHQAMPKAQTRVIFDGKWVPVQVGRVFVTAARDKTVKVWTLQPDGKEWTCTETVKFEEPITAIDILDCPVTVGGERFVLLALGLESGMWSVYRAAVQDGGIGTWERYLQLEAWMVPDKTITQISWRPTDGEETGTFEVALSSDDSSVRIYEVSI